MLAVSSHHPVITHAGKFQAKTLAARIPKQAWQRLSAGAGAKGERYYGWAQVEVHGPVGRLGQWCLLVRRNLAMLAHAFLAVTAAAEGRDRPNPDGLIPLTGNEIQHLFAALVSPIHELAQPCTGHTGDASIKPAHASVITAGKPPPSRKDRDLRWSTRQKPVRR